MQSVLFLCGEHQKNSIRLCVNVQTEEKFLGKKHFQPCLWSLNNEKHYNQRIIYGTRQAGENAIQCTQT